MREKGKDPNTIQVYVKACGYMTQGRKLIHRYVLWVVKMRRNQHTNRPDASIVTGDYVIFIFFLNKSCIISTLQGRSIYSVIAHRFLLIHRNHNKDYLHFSCCPRVQDTFLNYSSVSGNIYSFPAHFREFSLQSMYKKRMPEQKLQPLRNEKIKDMRKHEIQDWLRKNRHDSSTHYECYLLTPRCVCKETK